MKKTLTITALLLTLAGCASTAPGAEKVLLTRNPKDVSGCNVIGPLNVRAEMFTSGANDMRNAAFGYGADTVFITSASVLGVENYQAGVAYNCKGIDLRQPVPVTKVQ